MKVFFYASLFWCILSETKALKVPSLLSFPNDYDNDVYMKLNNPGIEQPPWLITIFTTNLKLIIHIVQIDT